MRFLRARTAIPVFLVLALAAVPGLAQTTTSESDALNLEGAKPEVSTEAKKDTRVFVEGALGNSSQRYMSHSRDLGRASFDLTYATRVGTGLRFAFSDRIDNVGSSVGREDVISNASISFSVSPRVLLFLRTLNTLTSGVLAFVSRS